MDTLPDELIVYILDEIDLASIWNLGHVNKRLSQLVKPHLYERVSFDNRLPELFLRTLAASPILGSLVKRIKWDEESVSAKSQLHYLPSRRDARDAFRCIRHYHEDATAAIPDRYKVPVAVSFDPYLATSLLCTPQLEELNIVGVDRGLVEPAWTSLRLVESFPLSSLTVPSLSGEIRQNFSVVPFLMLPSLRKMEVKDVPNLPFIYVHPYIHAKSPIEHLRLEGATIRLAHVAGFIGVARGLKTFSLQCRGDRSWPMPTSHTVLATLLREHCHSLEHVFLRLGGHPDNFISREITHCFKPARKLRSLDIEVVILFEDGTIHQPLLDLFKSLPGRLESLNLHIECYPCHLLIPTLRTIVYDILVRLPMLERLTIVGWDWDSSSVLGQRDLVELQTIFADRGVLFVSQPPQTMDPELSALNYVKPEWVFIQSTDTESYDFGRWMESPEAYYDDMRIGLLDEEGPDGDWVFITIGHGAEFSCASNMKMDQYLVEQPVWYWEELCRQRDAQETVQRGRLEESTDVHGG